MQQDRSFDHVYDQAFAGEVHDNLTTRALGLRPTMQPRCTSCPGNFRWTIIWQTFALASLAALRGGMNGISPISCVNWPPETDVSPALQCRKKEISRKGYHLESIG
jgi:hypothetical protein